MTKQAQNEGSRQLYLMNLIAVAWISAQISVLILAFEGFGKLPSTFTVVVMMAANGLFAWFFKLTRDGIVKASGAETTSTIINRDDEAKLKGDILLGDVLERRNAKAQPVSDVATQPTTIGPMVVDTIDEPSNNVSRLPTSKRKLADNVEGKAANG